MTRFCGRAAPLEKREIIAAIHPTASTCIAQHMFEENRGTVPLAERLRPRTIDDVTGLGHQTLAGLPHCSAGGNHA